MHGGCSQTVSYLHLQLYSLLDNRDMHPWVSGLLMLSAALVSFSSAETLVTGTAHTFTKAASPISLIDAGDRKFLLSNKIVFTITDNLVSVDGSPAILYDELALPSAVNTGIPITIIDYPPCLPQDISAAWLKRTISEMLSVDDVFCAFFLETLLFRVPGIGSGAPLPNVAQVTHEALKGMGVRQWYFLRSNEQLASGPYFLREGGGVTEAMRAYDDPYKAFLYGVVQDGDGFTRLPTDLIAVPSRLHAKPSIFLPLAGKRIAVKDIIDLRNLPTGASSRDYAAYHGPANTTALAVQKLLSLGATVIGKTKTTQFANGEAARDWIEEHCPFNPRADGYLDPAGSSTGSAAAVAGYDWVDYALGTDRVVNGDTNEPGVYEKDCVDKLWDINSSLWERNMAGSIAGSLWIASQSWDFRASWRHASFELDTLGFFARGVEDMQLLQQVWYGQDAGHLKNKLSKIIVPKGVFDRLPASKRPVLTEFVDDMTKTTSLAKVDLDVDKIWQSSGLATANQSYTDYLYSTVAHLQIWDSHAHEFTFYNNYRERFGKAPYINPQVLHKWAIRANITKADYAEAVTRKETFKSFLASHIFNDGAVMALPAGGIAPMYRDELIPPESVDAYLQSFGFDDTFYSILGGLPSVIIPVGQRSVVSRVTGDAVWEPVSMMLVGPAGSEGRIIELVRTVLRRSGRQMRVQVGAAAYTDD
ncbi:hypothetical protein ABW21_db0208090 [Orbilia brochopaga]|nr:hypothetical protein ABW21_db0208090 [Drechslerella brochopaga]